jgi:anaerobic selenocysteine-containing dehydrogenase
MAEIIYRTCNLCEALCGLKIDVEDNRVIAVGSDKDDVFSQGYACPKGMVIGKLAEDPDRLRQPMLRQADGSFRAIDWDEALDLAAGRINAIRKQHGNDAVAFYQGNPSGHQHGSVLTSKGLLSALQTRSSYNASSQDTNPRFAVSHYLYGVSMAIPVPDIDRTAFFLCVGANPLVSNGSLMTAPNMRKRIRGVQQRGGTVVVVDPCRTETAKKADWHLAIRPGGDAALLLSMLRVLQKQGRIDRQVLADVATGWNDIAPLLAAFEPEVTATVCGIDAHDIERLALDFASAPSAVCYTRVGVCLNRYSTLATWAGDLLNIVTGNLGRVGGAMFPTPPMDLIAMAAADASEGIARWGSRVRDLPEAMGVLPTTALAEEIETAGPGQVRAFISLMGNPVISAPNGKRLAAALATLDFMVSIDAYINETTRHAHLILPSAHPLTQDYISAMYPMWSVRNIARWSPPVLQQQAGEKAAWEIMQALSERLGGGATGNALFDRLIRLGRRVGLRWTPTRMAALLIRLGPYGDRFMPFRKGLRLQQIMQAPHGIDLGPLRPGFTHRIFHQDRKLQLAPKRLLDALRAHSQFVSIPVSETGLQLIGRRELRSNNSWMHNIPELMTGESRCVLWVNPEDAKVHHIDDGDVVTMRNRVHEDVVTVHITDDIRPGVVSLPHGYGHKGLEKWQKVASQHAGVSVNDWIDDAEVEMVVAQSIMNGVRVELVAKGQPEIAMPGLQ